MSRKAIIILIVITALFAIIAFVSVKTSPSIENAFITDNNKNYYGFPAHFNKDI